MPVGDLVRILGGEAGRIVCDFDNARFSPEYPEADWGGRGHTGLLVLMDRGPLARMERADVSIVSD